MFKAQISNLPTSQLNVEDNQNLKRQPNVIGFKQVSHLANALLENPYSKKSVPCGYESFANSLAGPLNPLNEGEEPAKGLDAVTIQVATAKTMHVAATRLSSRHVSVLWQTAQGKAIDKQFHGGPVYLPSNEGLKGDKTRNGILRTLSNCVRAIH